MTGSARRLPGGRTPIRLSPRTRALIAARRANAHRRPQRLPLLRILLGVAVALVLTVGSMGTLALGAAAGAVTLLSSGLPNPADLESLTFNQPTIIYDRTGTIELARFEREKRRVV